MKYFLMFIVLASITSCIVREPFEYKYVSVTLIEIRTNLRLVDREYKKETWYVYKEDHGTVHSFLIPINNVKTIGSTHLMYQRK